MCVTVVLWLVGWLDGRGRLCASTLRSIHPHTHSHPDVPTFHCTADTLVLQSTTTPFWMVEAAVTPVRVLPAPHGRTMMPGVSVSGLVCLVWCFFGGGVTAVDRPDRQPKQTRDTRYCVYTRTQSSKMTVIYAPKRKTHRSARGRCRTSSGGTSAGRTAPVLLLIVCLFV